MGNSSSCQWKGPYANNTRCCLFLRKHCDVQDDVKGQIELQRPPRFPDTTRWVEEDKCAFRGEGVKVPGGGGV